jgi:hypothetical protein
MGCMHAKVGNAFVLCGYQDSNIEVSCGAAAALQGLGDGSRLAIFLKAVRAQFLCCCCGHPVSLPVVLATNALCSYVHHENTSTCLVHRVSQCS